MGRKVHPYGFRLGIIKPWRARWFAEGDEYGELLTEDIAIRELVNRQLGHAGISDIVIEREGFTLYLPLATSLIVSLGLTLVLWLLSR